MTKRIRIVLVAAVAAITVPALVLAASERLHVTDAEGLVCGRDDGDHRVGRARLTTRLRLRRSTCPPGRP